MITEILHLYNAFVKIRTELKIQLRFKITNQNSIETGLPHMQQGPHAHQWELPNFFHCNSADCCAGDLLWAGRLIRVLSSSYGILLDCTEDTDIEDSKKFLNPSFPKLTARITSPVSEVTAPSPRGMLQSLAWHHSCWPHHFDVHLTLYEPGR